MAIDLTDIPVQQLRHKIRPVGYGFFAFKSAGQSGLVHNTYTKITFNTERFDIGNYYDTSTSRWTPPAGLVLITAASYADSAGASNSTSATAIAKNGSIYLQSLDFGGVAGAVPNNPIFLIDSCNGTDFYEVYDFYQSATAANDGHVDSNPIQTYFSGMLIR